MELLHLALLSLCLARVSQGAPAPLSRDQTPVRVDYFYSSDEDSASNEDSDEYEYYSDGNDGDVHVVVSSLSSGARVIPSAKDTYTVEREGNVDEVIAQAYKQLLDNYTKQLAIERALAELEAEILGDDKDRVAVLPVQSTDNETNLPSESSVAQEEDDSSQSSSEEDEDEEVVIEVQIPEDGVLVINDKITTTRVEEKQLIVDTRGPFSPAASRRPILQIEDPEMYKTTTAVTPTVEAPKTEEVAPIIAQPLAVEAGGEATTKSTSVLTITVNLGDLFICAGALVLLVWVLSRLWRHFVTRPVSSSTTTTTTSASMAPPLPAKQLPPPAYSPPVGTEKKVSVEKTPSVTAEGASHINMI